MSQGLKRSKSLWIVLSVSLTLVDQIPEVESKDPPFPDMHNSWFEYQEAVEYLVERDVISGYPDGTFKPKDPINRAEFLKIVFKGRSDTEPSASRCFSDVASYEWYAPYVCAAKNRGIVKGYDDGTFKPDQTVNIAEAMKMLTLAYGNDVTESPNPEKWYEAYTNEFDEKKIFPRHSYHPWDFLDRERAADLLANTLKYNEDRLVANLSAGCGKAQDDAPTTITVNSQERSFILDAPRRYVSHDPYPLIIAFHGRTNPNERVRSYFGLTKEATDYFVAYPAALQKDTGTFYWTEPGDRLNTLRDIAFFDAIVQTLGRHYCIDMDRIFVVGHSLGAWFANSVACARGDVIRGSATVGGSSTLGTCSGPSAAMIINNPKDTLSPHKGAEMTRDQRISSNGCSHESNETAPQSLKCTEYKQCDDGNPVVWCPHDINQDPYSGYYPHLWPDETADTIVQFFGSL